ncbi:MAG: hypothetical protein H0V78_09510 [Burkholderiales bacterium]|nr:hypothetical protein [Burkholderiales bacterium]
MKPNQSFAFNAERLARQTMQDVSPQQNRYRVSNQPQAQDLFSLWSRHLGNDRLFEDVRTEVHDANAYLDSARNRRMTEAGVRLGVVATFGFIGTVTTGFLGMNLIDETAASCG